MISAARYAVVILPAAYLLSRSLGANGVWHAFWITEAAAAVFSAALFALVSKKELRHKS